MATSICYDAAPTCDGDGNAFRFAQNNLAIVFLRHLIEWVHFVLDLDPNAIYKGNFKHSTSSKYWIHLSKDLRESSTRRDRWRNSIRLPAKIAICLLAANYMTVSLIQIVFSATMQRIHLNPVTARAIANMTTLVDTIEYQTGGNKLSKVGKAIIKQVDEYGSLLAGPFWAPTGASILVQSTLAVTLVCGYIIMPWRYKYTPMDNVNLRFILNPSREVF